MLSSIVSVFCVVAAVNGLPFGQNARVVGRDAKLRPAYDFVIVGGGTSGLTVADRLTEDPESEYVSLRMPNLVHRQSARNRIFSFMIKLTINPQPPFL
jgi:hypothetical protein